MIGPIEAETLAERAARKQIKEQSRNIASGNTSEQGNAMCLEWGATEIVAIYMVDLERYGDSCPLVLDPS